MSARKDVEAGDPLEIVGVVFDRPMDAGAVDEMARTFIEEYALMGWGRGRILEMFRRPFYGGAHDAYERLGEPRIVELIDQTLGPVEEPSDA